MKTLPRERTLAHAAKFADFFLLNSENIAKCPFSKITKKFKSLHPILQYICQLNLIFLETKL